MKRQPASNPIDIVIPHTDSSEFQHNELRYTLRSIEKNLTGYRNIFIVGFLPKFITGVIHIPCTNLGKTKDHRILHKILFAINDPRVSNVFLYMSDDHYLLKKFTASKFPYYYDMSLKDAAMMPRQSSVYQMTIQNTCDVYPDGKHYNVHSPVVYEKQLFKDAMEAGEWGKKGYLIKSMYCNYVGAKGLQMPDCKIREGMDYAKVIENKPFFSIGVNLNYHKLRRLMDELYPEPSCFEAEEKVYLQKR